MVYNQGDFMRLYFLNSFISILFFSFCFSLYQVGDQISETVQNRQHEVCYGAEYHGIEPEGGRYNLSLGDLNGFINETGVFYVTMIDMAASW